LRQRQQRSGYYTPVRVANHVRTFQTETLPHFEISEGRSMDRDRILNRPGGRQQRIAVLGDLKLFDVPIPWFFT
jgi:hypothetical protein